MSPTGPSGASQVLNFVIRMVVPMRREFGRSLDVQRFMHEPEYARAVLDEALGSSDGRLREYAAYVQRHLMGPREGQMHASAGPGGTAAAAGAGAAPSASASPASPASPATLQAEPPDDEAALRERLLKKYTGGLR